MVTSKTREDKQEIGQLHRTWMFCLTEKLFIGYDWKPSCLLTVECLKKECGEGKGGCGRGEERRGGVVGCRWPCLLAVPLKRAQSLLGRLILPKEPSRGCRRRAMVGHVRASRSLLLSAEAARGPAASHI